MQNITIAMTVLILAGCATAPGGYRSTPTAKLCMDWLTFPSYNINQNERANELARRGENCQGYAGAASVRNKSDAQFENSLRSMQQQGQPAAPSNRTYVMPGGKVMNCTTTGSVTNCY